MTPIERFLSALEARGLAVKGDAGRGWTAQCPAHDDRNASLSITVGDDDRVLAHCHAGCATEAVVHGCGLEMRDLFPPRQEIACGVSPARSVQKGTFSLTEPQVADWARRIKDERLFWQLHELRAWAPEALTALQVGYDGERVVFPTRDAIGRLIGLCRYLPGAANRPGKNRMVTAPGSCRGLFPAPESIRSDDVWIVEGEPDCVSAHTLGLPAVALPGADFSLAGHIERFTRFRRVYVPLDCDTPGRTAAKEIATALAASDVRTYVLDLDPARDDGRDVGDVLCEAAQDGAEGIADAGSALERLAAEAEPVSHSESLAKQTRSALRDGAAGWPKPLDAAAFHGLVGEITRTIEPHTEADPAAVLVSLLVAYGNVIGRGAGFRIGGTFHATNLNVLLVGPTSSGRKGTAGDEAGRVFELVDQDWARHRVASGLSTGEGLVWQVRDPIYKRRKPKKGEISNLPDGWSRRLMIRANRISACS